MTHGGVRNKAGKKGSDLNAMSRSLKYEGITDGAFRMGVTYSQLHLI